MLSHTYEWLNCESKNKTIPYLNLPALQQKRWRLRHSHEQHQMQDGHDQTHPEHRMVAQVLAHDIREQVAQVLRENHQAAKSSPDGILTNLLDV